MTRAIVDANSSTSESIKEFLKLNEKKKILNSNNQIESMFNKAKYQEIIDQLEEFADTHKPVSLEYQLILNFNGWGSRVDHVFTTQVS